MARIHAIIVALLLVFVARPAVAEPPTKDDKVFAAATALVFGLDLFDGYTTVTCVHEFPAQCREANYVLAPFAKQYGIKPVIAGKLVANAAILATVAILRHKHPEWNKITTGSVLTMGGVQIAVDISNARTLNRLRAGH